MAVLSQLVLNPPLNVTVVHDAAGLDKLQDFFNREKVIGWDIETNPVKDFWYRKCRTCQFGTVSEQWVVDLLSMCNGDSDLLFRIQGSYGEALPFAPPLLEKFLKIILPVLATDKWLKVGVNLGFEYMTFYWNFGIRSWKFYDCMLAEKRIYAGYHSLKDYSFFGMEEMMNRYFWVEIDKSLQESFTVDKALSREQYEYAALDTRLPLAIKGAQELIITGQTIKSRKEKGLGTVILERINPFVTGDDLTEIVEIENNAIGAFQDMHIHGERIDTVKWMERIAGRKVARKETVVKLDEIFIPIVGKKVTPASDEEVSLAKIRWESFKKVTVEELNCKGEERKKLKAEREKHRDYLAEEYKELKSRATKKYRGSYEKYEGEALINYGSSTQLLEVLNGIQGLKNLKDTNDDTLEQFNYIPVIKLIQDYREIDKEITTYGEAWATKWVTHPCKEEGWLHPEDGRIHHVYNQCEAETGRSSSEKPNGQNVPPIPRKCYIVDPPDEDEPDGYVYVTADMSGAELRIIAELADDPIWIGAFSRGEDVHSVGTELLYEEEWPRVQLPDCNYFKLKPDGTPQRKKCKCPEHEHMRKDNKSTNFLLAYGGGPSKLAREIKKAFHIAKALMYKHSQKFPKIWAYLDKSGKMSRILKRSFDMYGGRRLFPDPTWELAKEKAREDRKEKLEYPAEIQKKNRDTFIALHGRKPNKEENWFLTHRDVTSKEIGNAMQAMGWSTERQGKNHAIQGTNASIAKIAMAILWHELPKYKAQLKKFVHDELVVQAPRRFGEEIAQLIGKAFRDAAAIKMTKVIMQFDYKVSDHWEK